MRAVPTFVEAWCLIDLGRYEQAAELFVPWPDTGVSAHAIRTRTRYAVREAMALTGAGAETQAAQVIRDLLPAGGRRKLAPGQPGDPGAHGRRHHVAGARTAARGHQEPVQAAVPFHPRHRRRHGPGDAARPTDPVSATTEPAATTAAAQTPSPGTDVVKFEDSDENTWTETFSIGAPANGAVADQDVMNAAQYIPGGDSVDVCGDRCTSAASIFVAGQS